MESKQYRIGLLVDYINSEYTTTLTQGIKTACKDFNIDLFVFVIGELHNISIPYDYQCVAVAALATKKNLDGVIISSGTQMHFVSKEELTTYIKSFNPLPVVNIASEIPDVPSIVVECRNAYKTLIDELVDNQGAKKIGVMGVRSNSTEVKVRTNYIKEILEEKKIPAQNITYWKSNFEYGTTMKLLEDYYAENDEKFDFDTIFALNDDMAFACMDFCEKIGLKVPEDVIVAGFDDIQRSSFSNPTLTTITQIIENQTYAALVHLKEILDGNPCKNLKVLEGKAVFRESTQRKPYSKEIADGQFAKIDLDSFEKINKSRFSATEWYSKKSQLYHVARYFTDMQTDISLQLLKDRMNDDMRAFGLKAVGIVIYDNPIEMTTPFDYFNLPHKAKLVTGYDDENAFDTKTIKKTISFDPNEKIFPDDTFSLSSDGTYVMALYHNTLQYGYLIFKPGNWDIEIYDIFHKFLCTLVSSIYSFTMVHNEQTKFKQKYNQLDIIARTDELTGLLNRRGLYDLGKRTLKFAESLNQSGIIVYCDMDGLKKINDKFGHEAGDKAIVAEGNILKKNFRSNDVVARLGGDEFAIISPGLTEEAFIRIRNQITDDCTQWVRSNKSPFDLSISMGFVSYPSVNDGYAITSLLAEADGKLYEEKRNKRN